MPNDEARELQDAVDKVVNSQSEKKLVVAGPGAGKTHLFKKLLEAKGGDAKRHLVITFVNNLKDDLEANLGDLARVFTLHGYCQFLLHHDERLRAGLESNFVCYPKKLTSLIKRDWEYLHDSDAPEFVKLMRQLELTTEQYEFYLSRSNYYNSVDFDDSVYRIHESMRADRDLVPDFDLVLIDEFQDFNKLEASVVGLLGESIPIVVAGDDDQVLYSTLRQADSGHIRNHHSGGEFEVFYLPFCMRCPKVIVDAVASIFQKAAQIGALSGRIQKPYRYCELKKGKDSLAHPYIDLVRASVQRSDVNYFGKYIEQFLSTLPQAEAEEAAANNEPLVLIIGSKPYMPQIEAHLVAAGLFTPRTSDEKPERDAALEILAAQPNSNLGWRIILNCSGKTIARERVRAAREKDLELVEVIPPAERDAILAEAKAKVATPQSGDEGRTISKIKLTSYEGSKGLSAQYVFLVGLHERELPKDAARVTDLEICRFVVGLTRTKKKCTVLIAGRFGNVVKQPSVFLSWIDNRSYNRLFVNAAYWQRV
jgi:superfamily I DNA/RNA helicase